MATTGDIFRSYRPSGTGRDTQLFISKTQVTPHTSKAFDPFHSPSLKSPAPHSHSRTDPPPKLLTDGNGRDSYLSGGSSPPLTSKTFHPYIAPSPILPPKPSKGYHYSIGIRAGYLPNGSGRDLQLFVDHSTGDSTPFTGTQFSTHAPSPERHANPVSVSRSEPPPKTRPCGSGRDLFQVALGGKSIPCTAVQFSSVAPAHKGALLAPRTSPPPRFLPSGSGRDTFNRTEKNGEVYDDAHAFGFGPPRWDPASLCRPKVTRAQVNSQHARTETLSQPRASTASSPIGLMLPGAFLRQ